MIKPEVIEFLKKLKNNNNRPWFAEHKSEYLKAREIVNANAQFIFLGLKETEKVSDFKIYRVYRDVRFSKDKTPLKTNISAYWNRKKPNYRGGYFMSIEPENSFIAAGFWNPEKEDLFTIRKAFETDSSKMRKILSQKEFKKAWGEMIGNQLKTAPKNFSKEDPNIDLIRKKQFLFQKFYSDKEIMQENFIDKVEKDFKLLRPFLDEMTNILVG